MFQDDWQARGAYDYVDNLNSAGFAWELLRRHDDYAADYANANFRAALEDGADGPERRWGLRFRS